MRRRAGECIGERLRAGIAQQIVGEREEAQPASAAASPASALDKRSREGVRGRVAELIAAEEQFDERGGVWQLGRKRARAAVARVIVAQVEVVEAAAGRQALSEAGDALGAEGAPLHLQRLQLRQPAGEQRGAKRDTTALADWAEG